MSVGTAKWFNGQKGFGFIQPAGGGRGVIVRLSAAARAELTTLTDGRTVSCEPETDGGQQSAIGRRGEARGFKFRPA
ncbi:hypothetical protein VQ02_05695 [Methylobacterium variabile]|jgi:CspA family cold shock protein|uniref:CSD domain-containing protein n=1 Tax=Methylobacterium variabile TaxID=298794 RepID=A0A0J6T1Y6_9HYPH|nr:cold shock domain-containing protein [Methylobacterium variabile]KMO41460.1 hypothetical protein VQ02_05695 [Methylobacterium variabile]